MSKTTRPAAGARAGRDKLDEMKKAQQAKERRTRLVLITLEIPGSPAQDRAELQAMFDSISIEP